MNSIAAGTYSWLRYIFPVVAVPVQPNLPISTLWVYPRSIPKMVTLAQTPWKTGPNNPAEPRFSVPFQICDLTSFGGLREGCGGGSLDSLRGSGALKYNKEVTKIISINWITKVVFSLILLYFQWNGIKCAKNQSIRKGRGFFLNYSWGPLLLVTSLLKIGKNDRNIPIGCTISTDGFNTLINNFNHLARISSSRC